MERRKAAAVPTEPTRAVCIAAVRDLGTATVTEIAARASLSRPTVEGALADLEAAGLVVPATEPVQPNRAGGRPAKAASFAADRGVVAGIDLSGPTVQVVLCDLAGRQLVTGSAQPACPSGPDRELSMVTNALWTALNEGQVPPHRLRAVGVGVSGLVDRNGTVVNAADPGWASGNLRDRLESALGAPVVVENDLALAAVAEARFGALRGCRTGVYVLTWHHVSARVTIDGQVLRGRHSSAGEVGLLRSFADLEFPAGPLTQAVPVVAEELQRLREDPDDAIGNTALTWLTSSMTPAVAALALAVDPDVMVLGGALGSFADIIAPRLTALVNDFAVGGDMDSWIIGNDLGPEAVCIGAQSVAFERLSEQIYQAAGVSPPAIGRPLPRRTTERAEPAPEHSHA